MKKTFALLLCFLLFCLAGCSEKGESSKGDYPIDVGYYLSVGQFDTAEYGVGAQVKKLQEEAQKHSEEEGGDGHSHNMVLTETDEFNYFSADSFQYYYKPQYENKGISCIVAQGDIFGFSTGQEGYYTVKNSLSHLSPKEAQATEEDFFFMFMPLENCKKLTFTNGKYQLDMIFEEDILIASILYTTELWP